MHVKNLSLTETGWGKGSWSPSFIAKNHWQLKFEPVAIHSLFYTS